MKPKTGAILLRACAHCGMPFQPARDDQKYHAPSCRHAAWLQRHSIGVESKRLVALEERITALEGKT